jgi:hypothetical protein
VLIEPFSAGSVGGDKLAGGNCEPLLCGLSEGPEGGVLIATAATPPVAEAVDTVAVLVMVAADVVPICAVVAVAAVARLLPSEPTSLPVVFDPRVKCEVQHRK